MNAEIDPNSVRWYDASSFEEDAFTAAGYFFPPLGEAVVAELIKHVPDAQHQIAENAGYADHFRLSSAALPMMLDRAATLLRRESRYLVK